MFPISFVNEIFVARKAFDVYFIISAVFMSVVMMLSVRGLFSLLRMSADFLSCAPMTTLSGFR